MTTTSQFGYVRAVGDSDYNFGYNDFTVEFFVNPSNLSANVQTLFEITNNESPAASSYQQTRLLTLIENGQLNSYCLQTVSAFDIGTASYFESPIPINANLRLFYGGNLLESSQYTVEGSNVSLASNSKTNAINSVVEIAEPFFALWGTAITANTLHYVSAEKQNNHFYLYLDGVSQAAAQPAFQPIPAQILPNFSNGANVLVRTANTALLTIGANRDGCNPFYGEFGDFKITNGLARHVRSSNIETYLSGGSFTDSTLGQKSNDIVVLGGGFVDSVSSYAPEEQVPAQIFDTLYMNVYQSNVSNLNSNILGFSIFKPSIMIGPIGSWSTEFSDAQNTFQIPWNYLAAGDVSVLVNGVAQSVESYVIQNGELIANLGSTTTGNIQVIATGPTSYYTIAANAVSQLMSNLYSTDSAIYVSNANAFITPVLDPYDSTNITTGNVVLNRRGQVFINQECITYLYVNHTNNTLSGLMRGQYGTGVANLHLANSQVINASYNDDLSNLAGQDPGYQVWYTPGSNIYTSAATSLQNTYTTFSNILVKYGTVAPKTPF